MENIIMNKGTVEESEQEDLFLNALPLTTEEEVTHFDGNLINKTKFKQLVITKKCLLKQYFIVCFVGAIFTPYWW